MARSVRQSVPAVKGAVVGRFPARVKEQVFGNLVASAKAIIKVDGSTGNVEADVVLDDGLGGFGLKVKTALLLNVTNLMDPIAFHQRHARELHVGPVVILRPTPRCDCRLPKPLEGVKRDGSLVVVTGQKDGVGIL